MGASAERILGMMTKQPRPGRVKTRLAAETSAEWAAQAAAAFQADLLDRLASFSAERILVFDPPDAVDWFAALAAGRFELLPQSSGDLGLRMRSFFLEAFARGARRAILIGSDSPSLPRSLIDQAFNELTEAEVVLGPAVDGGYYLIGCARVEASRKRQRPVDGKPGASATGGRGGAVDVLLPPVFDGIAWGSPSVFADSLSRLRSDGWRTAILQPWYDVDTLADWLYLKGCLEARERAEDGLELPRTAALPDPPGP